jgi:hypothetical protein
MFDCILLFQIIWLSRFPFVTGEAMGAPASCRPFLQPAFGPFDLCNF